MRATLVGGPRAGQVAEVGGRTPTYLLSDGQLRGGPAPVHVAYWQPRTMWYELPRHDDELALLLRRLLPGYPPDPPDDDWRRE